MQAEGEGRDSGRTESQASVRRLCLGWTARQQPGAVSRSQRRPPEAGAGGFPAALQTWGAPEDQGSGTCVKMLSARLTAGAHIFRF